VRYNNNELTHLASKSLGVRMSAMGTRSSLYTSTSSLGTYWGGREVREEEEVEGGE